MVYIHPIINPNSNITYTSLHNLIHKHYDNGCSLLSCWLVMILIMDEVWCYAGVCDLRLTTADPARSPSFCCCGLLFKMKPRACLPVTAVMPLLLCRSAQGVVDRCV